MRVLGIVDPVKERVLSSFLNVEEVRESTFLALAEESFVVVISMENLNFQVVLSAFDGVLGGRLESDFEGVPVHLLLETVHLLGKNPAERTSKSVGVTFGGDFSGGTGLIRGQESKTIAVPVKSGGIWYDIEWRLNVQRFPTRSHCPILPVLRVIPIFSKGKCHHEQDEF